MLCQAGGSWDYQQESGSGPRHWHGQCATGKAQSPINIVGAEAATLPDWRWSGYTSQLTQIRVKNTGHSLKLELGEGGGAVPRLAGADLPGQFIFAQAHFHWGNTSGRGSEHLVDGRASPLELHLVHYNAKYGSLTEAVTHRDGLAVVGVLHKLTAEDSPALAGLVGAADRVTRARSNTTIQTALQLRSLLPADLDTFYRYSGSLTTPGLPTPAFHQTPTKTLDDLKHTKQTP